MFEPLGRKYQLSLSLCLAPALWLTPIPHPKLYPAQPLLIPLLQAANFPFCTIEPNVGIVAVPDNRLETLSNLSGSGENALLPLGCCNEWRAIRKSDMAVPAPEQPVASTQEKLRFLRLWPPCL